MNFKYILLFLSLIVIGVVFYKQYTFGKQWREGFENAERADCKNYNDEDSMNLPLREYCVKACFNSAYDGNGGNDVSVETLKTRIQEGYRFIDLNVYSASGDVYVGFSQNNAPEQVSPNLKLQTALETISENAFSKNESDFTSKKMTKIGQYPIFVHIRVYRRPGSTIDIISKVAEVINGLPDTNKPPYTRNYLQKDGRPTNINNCTKLSEIMGKIVFSMDILNILEIYAPPNNQTIAGLLPNPKMDSTIQKMQSFVNVLTGGNTIPAFYRYSEESIIYRTNKLDYASDNAVSGKNLKTNVDYLYIAFPHPDDVKKDSNHPNGTDKIQPDPDIFILSRSIQITPVRVYLADELLAKYINIFDNTGTPFSPMYHVYTYLQNGVKTTPTTSGAK